MKRKWFLLFLWIFAILISCFGMVVSEIKDCHILSVLSGSLFAIFIEKTKNAIEDVSDNITWKESLRKLKRGKLITNTTLVRISFAYLFRIKIDNKYLLVKNERGTGKYQPVGGVYKFFDNEKNILMNKFKVVDDSKLPIDKLSKNDYRLFVPCKFLKRFINRFNSSLSSREKIDDLSREFCEELGDVTNWESIKYRYCGRHFTELRYSDYYQCYELLLADIVDLELTDEQKQDIVSFMSKRNQKYHFATNEEIKSRGIVSGTNKQKEIISSHTEKILQDNEQFLIKEEYTGHIFEVSL